MRDGGREIPSSLSFFTSDNLVFLLNVFLVKPEELRKYKQRLTRSQIVVGGKG